MYKLIIYLLILVVQCKLYSLDKEQPVKLGSHKFTQDSVYFLSSGETLINKEYINNHDYITLDNVFTFFPSVYFYINEFSESEFYIRGLDHRFNSILFDGIPLSNSYNEFVDLNRFPTEPIHNIFLDKSSPSFLFNIPVAGAINFLSQELQSGYSTHLNAEGSLFTGNAMIGHNGAYGSLFWSIAGSYNINNFYNLPEDMPPNNINEYDERENSRSERLTLYSKLGIRSNSSSIAAGIFTSTGSKDIPQNIYNDQLMFMRNTYLLKNLIYLNFRTDFSDLLAMKGNVFFNKYKYTLMSFDNDDFNTQNRETSFTQIFNDQSIGASFYFQLKSFLESPFNFGVNYINMKIKHHNDVDIPVKIVDAESLSIMAEQEMEIIDSLQTKIGFGYQVMNPLNFEDGTNEKSYSALSYSLDLDWLFKPDYQLNLSVSNRKNLPEVNQFINIDSREPFNFNENLKEEDLLAFCLGFEQKYLLFTSIKANIFWNIVNDYIAFKRASQDSLLLMNFEKADIKGVEIAFGLNSIFLNLDLNYTFTSPYLFENGNKSIMANRPRHMFNAIVSAFYDIGFSWFIESGYRAFRYGYHNNELKKMDDYMFFNVKASQRIFDNYELYLRVNNITDEYYESIIGYPQPGRNIILGFNIRFSS